MRVLSLFDGISCGRLALERAGIPVEVYYASEIDKYATAVSEKNYPDIIRLGDVTEIDFSKFVGKVDLIIGGSPCQDLSIAKADRKGLQGDRSGLFWRFVDAVKTIKPKYFLLENVASMKKEDCDIITKALGVEPIMINSSLLSAQQRKRYYWCNWEVSQPDDKGIVLKDILEFDTVTERLKGFCLDSNYYKGISLQYYLEKHKRQVVFAPIRVGNVGNSSSQGNRVYSVIGKSVSLSANGVGLGAKTGLYKIDLPDGDYIIRKLTPVECERLQTLPDNYTAGVSNTQRYKMIGNGWTVDVIAHILKGLK